MNGWFEGLFLSCVLSYKESTTKIALEVCFFMFFLQNPEVIYLKQNGWKKPKIVDLISSSLLMRSMSLAGSSWKHRLLQYGWGPLVQLQEVQLLGGGS